MVPHPRVLADDLFVGVRYRALGIHIQRRPIGDSGGAVALRALAVAAVDYEETGLRGSGQCHDAPDRLGTCLDRGPSSGGLRVPAVTITVGNKPLGQLTIVVGLGIIV